MEKFKEIMKRIGELINSFANPVEPEKDFDELLAGAGIGGDAAKALKLSKEGISWKKFAREEEPTKKSKTLPKHISTQENPTRTIKIEHEKGIDRD